MDDVLSRQNAQNKFRFDLKRVEEEKPHGKYHEGNQNLFRHQEKVRVKIQWFTL